MIEIREVDPVEFTHNSDIEAALRELTQYSLGELGKFPAVMTASPDVDKYRAFAKAGILRALLAYDGPKIVGYSTNIVVSALHHSHVIMAQNDLLYLHPDYRNGKQGLRLIRETEAMVKRAGASILVFGCKEGTTLISLLPKLGYTVGEIAFCKEL